MTRAPLLKRDVAAKLVALADRLSADLDDGVPAYEAAARAEMARVAVDALYYAGELCPAKEPPPPRPPKPRAAPDAPGGP